MFDASKHPVALANATKAYVEATISIVRFLIAENEHMVKELQATKQQEEKAITSTRAEWRKVILDEVTSLETFMWKMYFKFITVHKSVVHLDGWQQHCDRRERVLADIRTVVDHMQIWKMRYKEAPLYLQKMMKPKAVELKAHIQI